MYSFTQTQTSKMNPRSRLRVLLNDSGSLDAVGLLGRKEVGQI